MEQIYIYGDSLLKATVPDESFRYHFHLPEVMNWYPRERVAVTNRSKMGATSTKGLQLVEHDVARGMDARYALVAYGGNASQYISRGVISGASSVLAVVMPTLNATSPFAR